MATNLELIKSLKKAIKEGSEVLHVIQELDLMVKNSNGKFSYKIKNQHVHVMSTIDGTIRWNN